MLVVIIDFLRTFIDKHHHGKEEKLLLNQMKDKLGVIGEKLITYGMLVEHDPDRLFIQQLEAVVEGIIEGNDESRLDVIANAIGYCDLLNRHIDKEDLVVFTYATKNLGQETLD